MNIKKYAIVMTVAGFIFSSMLVAPSQAKAATSIESLQALIQALQSQVAALSAQLQTLRQAQQQVVTTTGDVQDTLKLIKQLREGASGDDVKLLQTILAADVSIYPEGRITGYYGKLTAQAVKRFQKLYKLDQVGNVGPKTLEKIREQLEKNPVAVETRDGVKTICAIVPPGHLIAPGWLRKMGGVAPVIPVCQTLPQGIAIKLGLATTTPDTTAPMISDLEVKNVTSNSAKIEWETNEKATSVVWYGTSTPVSSGNALTVSSTSLVREHELRLEGLSVGTTYYYMVISKDAVGNTTTSSQYTFTTSAVADVAAPIVSSVGTASTTVSSSHIVWTTNEPATSIVWYGTSTPITTTNTIMTGTSTLVSGHDVALSGLLANTLYYYMVTSADASGNNATSSQYAFTTEAAQDTTAPTISGVSTANVVATSTGIMWTTNEPATSIVWYGTSTPATTMNTTMAGTSTSADNHAVTLSDLSANTLYYYMVTSADASGNNATSSEYSFTTSAMPDVTAPMISGLMATSTTVTSSHIVWTTDESATGKIWYAASTPVVTTGAPAISETVLTTGHDSLISGLTSGTTYYYVVASADTAGNTATSTEASFQTLTQLGY